MRTFRRIRLAKSTDWGKHQSPLLFCEESLTSLQRFAADDRLCELLELLNIVAGAPSNCYFIVETLCSVNLALRVSCRWSALSVCRLLDVYRAPKLLTSWECLSRSCLHAGRLRMAPSRPSRKRKEVELERLAEEDLSSALNSSPHSTLRADFSQFRYVHAISPVKSKRDEIAAEDAVPAQNSGDLEQAKKEGVITSEVAAFPIEDEGVDTARMKKLSRSLEMQTQEGSGDDFQDNHKELGTMPEFSRATQGGCDALLRVVDDLVVALAPLTFKAPVAYIYNPLEYAREPHDVYVRKYGGKKVEVLLVGMNPGPFGMAQTGVPFGDSVLVREFLQITGQVQAPEKVHPKRPIHGLNCPRREVSGQRLWGWAQTRFGTAAAFLDRFWVHNYCPLLFMEASGKNRTPDKLTATERAAVTVACNAALRSVIDLLQPHLVVGIGKYAGERIKETVPPGTLVGDIMHPSPANPQANKHWDKTIEAQLQALGVDL